ncbi:pilus assembly protein TadG-related protein [Halalkalibacter alkaliphilus]|uniref:Pilus assembly protein TadG-related protein n=1 Tax=Halalkalibacter alkaliphilus TaxID=2917993 RepID=A0A9X2CRQ6_9BACI|nr:pilus assembly protein TadG-related protein [Halalkalibacter alkaliphilus]MCL7746730.1 pilus assembly protein TadG-related protein [Halalkalibacter alkaliphilus]
MKRFLKQEEGAVIVLVALCMTMFIGFMALVIDMGSLYLEKSRLQKMADAAVLAAAQELPGNREKSMKTAHQTILLNGGEPTHFQTVINQSNSLIEVIGSKKGTLFFAKALGIKEPLIQAKAVVQLQPLSSGKGAIPLGVQPSMNLSFGAVQTLKVSDSASGNFGAIALTGTGARNYETDLRNGYEFELKVGAVLGTQTGNLAGPTRDAVTPRIAACPNATYLDYPPGCQRVVLIPIFEPVQADQNQIKQVRVLGFASFFIESVASTNQGAEVTGRFIQVAHSGESSQGQTNYGTFGFKLIQ